MNPEFASAFLICRSIAYFAYVLNAPSFGL